MATTDNVLSDLIINDLTQEEYDALVASGEVQEGQLYATDGTGSSGGGSTTGGLESVAHDSSLEGAGTTASPLKVASTVIAQINDKADGTVVETLSSVVSENTTKLNTLRNDTDSLGDQVSGIEEKIPSSASATNQLATKADLPIGFDATVVAELPATGEKGIIYLVPKDGEAPDVHDEYIWIDSEQKFEFIGSTAVDLTNYVKKTDYAGLDKAGIIMASSAFGTSGGSSGYLTSQEYTLSTYNSRLQSKGFISKGTLENIKDDLVARATANAVNTQNLTVGTDEGTLNISITAGTATIATNNGLDIVSPTKFDTAPTTDDNTTYADALDASLVRKAQVATAISGALNGKADVDLGNLPANFDYIVEKQESSAENNYTWYFKFKSGWVIMGGLTNSVTSTGQINCSATMPVPVKTLPTLIATPIYISGASVSVVTSYRSGNTIYVTIEKNWSGSTSTTAQARWFAVGIAE